MTELIEKQCTGCKEVKKVSEFRRHPQTKNGLTPRCKVCLNAENKKYYYKDIEARREYEKNRRIRKPEHVMAIQRAAQIKWRANPENRERKRIAYIAKKYGITIEQYEQMLVDQKSLCAICLRPPEPTSKGHGERFHIDHCHATGKVRGLLCYCCNSGLGSFLDNVEAVQRAAEYLKRSQES